MRMTKAEVAAWRAQQAERRAREREPLPGHDPGTFAKPGCPCPDCTWLRITE